MHTQEFYLQNSHMCKTLLSCSEFKTIDLKNKALKCFQKYVCVDCVYWNISSSEEEPFRKGPRQE